ncbi:MAG: hypothetical protein V1672_03505 [Candidatus Diapherotrites archaeon]
MKFRSMIILFFVILFVSYVSALTIYFEDESLCSGSYGACKELQWDSDEGFCRVVIEPNCCGNDICEDSGEYFEDFGNCPADCTPTKVDIEILKPEADDFYYRGETFLIKADVTAHGRSAAGSDVNAESTDFFKSIMLKNDGKHEDNKAFDSVYGVYVTISDSQKKEIYPVSVGAVFRGIYEIIDFNITVETQLGGDFSSEEYYNLGDLIEITGFVERKNNKISIPLDVNISVNENIIFETAIESDSNGVFKTEYHTSLIDPKGTWIIKVRGTDKNNNYVYIEKEVQVFEERKNEFLQIELIKELKSTYSRGENLEFIVEIKNESEELITGADVKMISPLDESVILNELKEGQYSAVYKINSDMPLEMQNFTINAKKENQEYSLQGTKDFEIIIEKSGLILDLIKPQMGLYKIGENIEIQIKVRYPDDEPVRGADVKALINKTELNLKEIAAGIYSTLYVLKEEDAGNIKIQFEAKDKSENIGKGEERIDVAGTDVFYLIQKNVLLIVLIAAILVILAPRVGKIVFRKKKTEQLKKRKQTIISLQKNLQKKYFKENSIQETEYNELMDDYENQIHKIDAELKELEKNE